MRSQKAFTLVELLISVALISVLAVTVTFVMNPVGKRQTATDSNLLELSTEVYKAITNYASDKSKVWWPAAISGQALSSEEAKLVLDPLIDRGELKASFYRSSGQKLDSLFLTVGNNDDLVYVCFLPTAKSFRKHELAHFSQTGLSGCTDNCYVCVGHNLTTTASVSSPTPIPLPTSDDPCYIPDPEYYHLPTTSFFLSDTFAQYNCDRYSVVDYTCNSGVRWWGTPCGSICESNERCLKKVYTRPGPLTDPLVLNCLSHSSQAVEYYCVSGSNANCTNHPEMSSDLDFLYGCSNPRRSIQWL